MTNPKFIKAINLMGVKLKTSNQLLKKQLKVASIDERNNLIEAYNKHTKEIINFKDH